MPGKTGAPAVTAAGTTRARRATSRATSSATRTWTITVNGAIAPSTARCGCRAPYPWGGTWIDDAPWGFAPFHYRRWVYWDGAWVWVPGRRVARPVYAPALGVFVGGRNWSIAIGPGHGGDVAWFPLAPEEPYVPAYHVSKTYIRNVNVTNVTVTNINVTNVNVTNIHYRNHHQPDAVTVVSHETFVDSRPVNQGVIVVPRDRLDRASVVGAAARVAPRR